MILWYTMSSTDCKVAEGTYRGNKMAVSWQLCTSKRNAVMNFGNVKNPLLFQTEPTCVVSASASLYEQAVEVVAQTTPATSQLGSREALALVCSVQTMETLKGAALHIVT